MNLIYRGVVYNQIDDKSALVGFEGESGGLAVVGSIDSHLSFLKVVNVGGSDLLVTKIGNYAFKLDKTIKSLHIHCYITEIGSFCFDWCSNCERITFEENSRLTTLGVSAFFNCSYSTITLPFSVSSISAGAFGNNHNLKTITYPGKNYINENNCFYNGVAPETVFTLFDYPHSSFCNVAVTKLIIISTFPQCISHNNSPFSEFFSLLINIIGHSLLYS